MKRRKELAINSFQLNRLMDADQQAGFRYLLEEGFFCNQCRKVCPGVRNYTLLLDPMNDVIVRGSCRACGGEVVRLIEFGEDEDFSARADTMRGELA